MDNSFIKRTALQEILEHQNKKEISLLIGPRQVGKTTLMKIVEKKAQEQGKKTVFLNLDFEEDKKIFKSQETLISKLKLELGDEKSVVFIDEIQRKKDAGLFLKGIYDMDLPYKFVVSGSGSVELKEKVHESLAGRKRIFQINPVSFLEFVNFKTEYKYENKLENYFEFESQKTEAFLLEYLNFGGYPRVILESQEAGKIEVIKEIYQSCLEKDIFYLLKIRKIEQLQMLLKVMASQVGSLVNYSELSNTLNLSIATVKNYLWYLEKTFVIKKVNPFYRNVRKEITKAPVFYFYDLGMRNFLVDRFGKLMKDSTDAGMVFENFIFQNLRLEEVNQKFRFWRTKDQAEVDLVLEKGDDLLPIEVKFGKMAKPKLERSLGSFIKKYSPKEAWVINRGSEKEEMTFGNTQVKFIPFWQAVLAEK